MSGQAVTADRRITRNDLVSLSRYDDDGPRPRRAEPRALDVGNFLDVLAALDSSADLDDLLCAIAAEASAIAGVRRCSVWLRDPESGLFPCAKAKTGGEFDPS